jgi:hypothetical protein
MNGLDPLTIVMVCLLAVVAAGVLGAFLGAVLWAMFGDLVLAVWCPVRAFLGRAFRDIVEGFKSAVEWAVYGTVYGS